MRQSLFTVKCDCSFRRLLTVCNMCMAEGICLNNIKKHDNASTEELSEVRIPEVF